MLQLPEIGQFQGPLRAWPLSLVSSLNRWSSNALIRLTGQLVQALISSRNWSHRLVSSGGPTAAAATRTTFFALCAIAAAVSGAALLALHKTRDEIIAKVRSAPLTRLPRRAEKCSTPY